MLATRELRIGVRTEVSGLSKSSIRGIASCVRIRSRALGPSPAIFPKPHTACSATLGDGDFSSITKSGTAPYFITTCVCSDVPEATLVNAHAASNCKATLYKNDEDVILLFTNRRSRDGDRSMVKFPYL